MKNLKLVIVRQLFVVVMTGVAMVGHAQPLQKKMEPNPQMDQCLYEREDILKERNPEGFTSMNEMEVFREREMQLLGLENIDITKPELSQTSTFSHSGAQTTIRKMEDSFLCSSMASIYSESTDKNFTLENERNLELSRRNSIDFSNKISGLDIEQSNLKDSEILIESKGTQLFTIICPPDLTVPTNPGTCYATGVNLGMPITPPNCTVFNDAWGEFPWGTTIVTWTAIDGSGNTATCTQNITVIDNELPTIICPADVTLETDAGICTATGVNLGTPITEDNCSLISLVHNAVEPFALGTTVVIWTVTDGAGNVATCTQNVIVVDLESPTITCPADVTVETDAGICTATGVNLGTPITEDNCSIISLVHNAVEPFALGTTVVIWTVTDGAGNVATCTQNVIVIDTQLPTITCPLDVTVNTDPGSCYATDVDLGIPTIGDNCSGAIFFNNSAWYFNFGINLITWTVTDGFGNVVTCTQNVTVVAPAPTANVGADMTVCYVASPYPVNGIVTNSIDVQWSTNGDGFFDNEFAFNTVYYSGTNDLLNGFVELCLTAYPDSPCPGLVPSVDCLILTFEPAPIAFAGNNTTICEGETFLLSEASASQYSSLEWLTDGDGTFNDPTIIHPVYTPGSEDIADGNVFLTIKANPEGACENPVIDVLELFILELPSISLAPELKLDCTQRDLENDVWLPFEVCAEVLNYSTIQWTTSGDGTFDNPNIPCPAYSLGPTDVWENEITLTITVNGIGPCQIVESASQVLYIPQQIIVINQAGYRGISSYIDKGGCSVEEVLEPIEEFLISIENQIGQIYSPSLGINEIGNWDPIGYKAHFSAPCCLPIYGDTLEYRAFCVSDSVTFLPALTAEPVHTGTLFGGYFYDIKLIYDWETGGIWTPSTAGALDTLYPGKAYLLKTNSSNQGFMVPFSEESEISVTPSNQLVSFEAGTTAFSVASNTNWYAESDQSWCSISTGGDCIVASFTQNNSQSPRIANITVSAAGHCPIEVTLMQSGTALNDNIVLNPGWNLISLDVIPNPATPDAVFAPLFVNNNLEIVTGFQNQMGVFYDPNGLPFLNSLQNIVPGEGYWVKVMNAATLSVSGQPISETFSINLKAGWNLTGYWLPETTTPEEAFATLITAGVLEMVTGYNQGGQMYDPAGLPFLNTLTEIKNGFGYWVKLNADYNGFSYPGAWDCGDLLIDDRDGKTYETVQIGTQCWMKQNLNVGARIDGVNGQTNNGTIEKYCYSNQESNCDVYGGLYRWDEMMEYSTIPGAQGICPDGWHVPTDVEWVVITTYLGGEDVAGGKMKESGTSHWLPPNTDATNSSEFTGLPGGMINENSSFYGKGIVGQFCSSSQYDISDSWIRVLIYYDAYLTRSTSSKQSVSSSVRCLKGEVTQLSVPSVSTSTISSIAFYSAISGGEVTSVTGIPVFARGVCWSTSQNPTISDNHSEDGTGTGTFVSNLTGLTSNSTYYVRAFATDFVGTAYGNQQSFTTLANNECPGSFIDVRDGNVYTTVQIGNQCWMKQNLNIGNRIDGAVNQTNNGIIEKHCYDNVDTNCIVFGGLYQWDEMMQYSTIEGVQGICPDGWHLPTDVEWTTLANFLGGESVAGGKLKEAGTSHWSSPNTGASNSSGFTALPGGFREINGTFLFISGGGYWWSSTEYSATSAWKRDMYCNSASVTRTSRYKSCGFSVRCLRDF